MDETAADVVRDIFKMCVAGKGPSQIAKTLLSDLNKVKKSFNVTLFGNDIVRSGRILVFNQPLIDLVGRYLVKNCSHSYNGKTHLMQLDLEENDG